MYSPFQSLLIKGAAGDPLPVVWKALGDKGTNFLRGQLGLICAGPGTGKSALILAYAVKAKVPTLYFSADSDAFTQVSRMLSVVTGKTMSESSNVVRSGEIPPEAAEMLNLPIRFDYKASPSLDQVETAMKAYDALYEDFPALIVVDNITNIRTDFGEGDDPFAGLEPLMDYLHEMARETGAFVAGLHHVTGPHNDGNKPIPLSGIKGQIGRVPELVLTLHRIQSEYGPDYLRVSTVKNRAGKADASGQDYVELEYVGETMSIKDPPYPTT